MKRFSLVLAVALTCAIGISNICSADIALTDPADCSYGLDDGGHFFMACDGFAYTFQEDDADLDTMRSWVGMLLAVDAMNGVVTLSYREYECAPGLYIYHLLGIYKGDLTKK